MTTGDYKSVICGDSRAPKTVWLLLPLNLYTYSTRQLAGFRRHNPGPWEYNDGEQRLTVVDEALAAHLIEELPGEAESYQFTHALVQETPASELSAARPSVCHSQPATSNSSKAANRPPEGSP